MLHRPGLLGALVLAAVLTSGGCSRAHEEPAPLPESKASPSTKTFERDGLSVRVPSGWQELPLETEKRRELFALKLNTPSSQPDILVLVSRPALFRGTLDDLGAFLSALVGVATTAVQGKLGGMDAIVETSETKNVAGKPVRMKVWGALRGESAFTVMCSATGEAAIANAEGTCARIVESFRPSPPSEAQLLDAPSDKELAVRSGGGFTSKIPRGWEPADPSWVTAPSVAVFRAPHAGGLPELASIAISVNDPATTAEAAAREMIRPPVSKLVKMDAFDLAEGRGVESEITFVGGETVFLYDVVVKGEAHELACRFPSRLRDAFQPICRTISKSFRREK